jgi:hypothetical protein
LILQAAMNNVTCGDMSSHLAITLSERSPTFKVRSSRVRSDDPPTLFSVVQGFLRSSRSSGPALRGSSTNRLEVELADGTSRSSKPMSSRKDARPSVPGSVRAVPLKHLVHRWWLSHKSVLTLPDRSVTPIDSGCGMSECEADALYARSQPVARMDKFVSHSWACGGKLKALALLHDQQRTLAIAVANGVWLVGSSIAIAIFAAAARRTGEPPTPMHRWMAFSLFVLVPTGLFFVVFLLDLPCRGGPRCFFDRVCIHQRDPLLKAQGIASLGECIECADRLLVLSVELRLLPPPLVRLRARVLLARARPRPDGPGASVAATLPAAAQPALRPRGDNRRRPVGDGASQRDSNRARRVRERSPIHRLTGSSRRPFNTLIRVATTIPGYVVFWTGTYLVPCSVACWLLLRKVARRAHRPLPRGAHRDSNVETALTADATRLMFADCNVLASPARRSSRSRRRM